MGQTEAPLTIRPFIAGLTESELFTIMVSGMAHVSGAVMVAYVAIAHVSIEHLLTAVVMTAPATIMLAKIFIPETQVPATAGRVNIKTEKTAVNVIDAAAQGRGRRASSGPQHRGDGDCVSGADCDGERDFGRHPWAAVFGVAAEFVATDFRDRVCAAGLADGSGVARLFVGGEFVGNAVGVE